MDVGWMWGGCRVDVGWMWGGCRVDVGRMWGGCRVDVGVPSGLPWGSLGVAWGSPRGSPTKRRFALCKVVQKGDWTDLLDYKKVPLLPANKKRNAVKVLDVRGT